MDAKTNGAMPATPCQPVDRCGNPCMEMALGLTKREAFAMAAMQGLLARDRAHFDAAAAVMYADRMLTALSQEPQS